MLLLLLDCPRFNDRAKTIYPNDSCGSVLSKPEIPKPLGLQLTKQDKIFVIQDLYYKYIPFIQDIFYLSHVVKSY